MFAGLTGGMGCGKSAALNFFAELGYVTIDADSICHTLYRNSESQFSKSLHKRWGDKIIAENGEIDRKVVGEIVFADKKELKWLNSILHPAVIKEGLKVYNNNKRVVTIFDVPLLFEVGWENHFDKIISVWCNEKIRMDHLLKRGMSEDEIKRRDKNQWDPELKMERADYAMINNSTLLHLQKQCKITGEKLTRNLPRIIKSK